MRQIDGNDVMIVGGMAALGYGLFMIWPPLTPIVLGVLALGIGLVGALRKGADQ